MEKAQGYATEIKYRFDLSGGEIQAECLERRGGAFDQVGALGIVKRTASTSNYIVPNSQLSMTQQLSD
jgi:hypothetical protein